MCYNYDENLYDSFNMIGEGDLERIEQILKEDLIKSGVNSAILIDRAGNIVAKQDNGQCSYDLYSFAALASANFAAVDTMAQIVGEKEFSLLFHKGKHESTHFSKVNEEYLLITIFSSEIHLGLLRLKIKALSEKINKLWKN